MHYLNVLYCMQFLVTCNISYQGAAKVSILMIGQQAILDAYLCLLHLTAGILVGEDIEYLVASTILVVKLFFYLKASLFSQLYK